MKKDKIVELEHIAELEHSTLYTFLLLCSRGEKRYKNIEVKFTIRHLVKFKFKRSFRQITYKIVSYFLKCEIRICNCQ